MRDTARACKAARRARRFVSRLHASNHTSRAQFRQNGHTRSNASLPRTPRRRSSRNNLTHRCTTDECFLITLAVINYYLIVQFKRRRVQRRPSWLFNYNGTASFAVHVQRLRSRRERSRTGTCTRPRRYVHSLTGRSSLDRSSNRSPRIPRARVSPPSTTIASRAYAYLIPSPLIVSYDEMT